MSTGSSGEEEHRRCALLRWKIGHQIFFVLIQGLIVTLSCLERSIRAGDLEEAGAALAAATALMHSSGASLRLAADFEREDYEQIVLPSMSAPHVTERFSGLMSSDHREMVRLLTRLRELLDELPGGLVSELEAFASALDETYEAHKLVCERFGGAGRPSLRMGERAKEPAVQVVDHLKRSRLRLVRPGTAVQPARPEQNEQ